MDDEKEMQTVKEKYGWLPKSIWYLVKDKSLLLFMKDNIGEDTYARGKPLSQFNPTVAKRIIEYWSNRGDKILDPFAGRTRILSAWNLDRHYTGYEISPKVCEYLKDKFNTQQKLSPKPELQVNIVNKDCRLMEHTEEFDLVFSCPPYFDVEDYNKLYEENVAGQMGSVHNYSQFLKMYDEVIIKLFKALKKGKFVVWVVNDIRREKTLIPFHSDTINLFLRNGFLLHDVVINELNSLSIMGVGACDKNHYTAKCHEYILVFQKPEVQNANMLKM